MDFVIIETGLLMKHFVFDFWEKQTIIMYLENFEKKICKKSYLE